MSRQEAERFKRVTQCVKDLTGYIRPRAEVWLESELYSSLPYQELVANLPNDFGQERIRASILQAALNLGLMELVADLTWRMPEGSCKN